MSDCLICHGHCGGRYAHCPRLTAAAAPAPPTTTVRAVTLPIEPAKTLRDEFAMAALTGLLAARSVSSGFTALDAYKIADAMLAVREGRGS